MPLYRYEVLDESGEPEAIFETIQPAGAAPLKKHPETGAPLRRLISSPNITLRYTERATNNMLKDNKKLEQMGFTKYEKSGKGTYERKAGKEGPKVISAD